MTTAVGLLQSMVPMSALAASRWVTRICRQESDSLAQGPWCQLQGTSARSHIIITDQAFARGTQSTTTTYWLQNCIPSQSVPHGCLQLRTMQAGYLACAAPDDGSQGGFQTAFDNTTRLSICWLKLQGEEDYTAAPKASPGSLQSEHAAGSR